MRAHAWLEVAQKGHPHKSYIKRQHSEGSLNLRPTIDAPPPWANAWQLSRQSTASSRLVAGAAGPVGGDYWRLDITINDHASLFFSNVAGTLILPGPHGEDSWSEINIHLGKNASLIWEPGVQIAAANCHHATYNRISMQEGARLFVREQSVLGRHGETPGNFMQRTRITYQGLALYDQALRVGPESRYWNGPAIMGGRRALGSLIIIDPKHDFLPSQFTATHAHIEDAATMPLNQHGALISALSHDAVSLRKKLDASFDQLMNPQANQADNSAKKYKVKRIQTKA